MRSWYTIRSLAEGAEVAIYDEIGAFGVSAMTTISGSPPSKGGVIDKGRIRTFVAILSDFV